MEQQVLRRGGLAYGGGDAAIPAPSNRSLPLAGTFHNWPSEQAQKRGRGAKGAQTRTLPYRPIACDSWHVSIAPLRVLVAERFAPNGTADRLDRDGSTRPPSDSRLVAATRSRWRTRSFPR